MANQPRSGFLETLSAAIDDIIENGFDSQERITYWVDRLRRVAAWSMMPLPRLEEHLNKTLRAIYQSKIEKGTILQRHPGISRFTLEKVKPKLRLELDRRIMASANLIKLNRQRAIETTLQRFAGWSTSIPPGGTDIPKRAEVKTNIRSALASLPFTERRVAIDQGHKFVNNLSNILATDGGAIAGIWHSHWRQLNYDFRPDHKERDLQVYTIRNNWAQEAGLMKAGDAGYSDEITQPGEEVYCRCYYQYLYSIRRLDDEMITSKGRAELERAKVA